MTDSFEKLADICIKNKLGAETVDFLVDIKKALEEKERLGKALELACDIITDLNDCTNKGSSKYPTCPFKNKCGTFDGCIGNKEKWKKYLMEL